VGISYPSNPDSRYGNPRKDPKFCVHVVTIYFGSKGSAA
jgi:hypothetical protein